MSLQVWLPLNGNIENLGICGDVTSTSTPEYTVGKLEKGISLNKRVDFTGLPKLTNFSIFFWARVDSCTTTWSDLLGFTCKQSNDAGAAEFRFEATVETRACSWHNNAPFGISSGSRILIQNYEEWHHVGVVYDGENIYSYIDGELTYTDTGLGGYLTTNFHIGETGKFVGAMSDLRIYDTVLSKLEVKEISNLCVVHYRFNDKRKYENLIVESNKESSWSEEGCTITSEADDKFGQCFKVVSSRTNGRIYRTVNNVWTDKTVPYTVSFWAKSTENGVTIDASRSIVDFSEKFTLTTEWHRYIGEITLTATNAVGTLSFRVNTSGKTVYITNISLIKGECDLDWFPNKEDELYSQLGFDENIIYDESGYGNNGTVEGNALTWNEDSAEGEYSVEFNGKQNIYCQTSSIFYGQENAFSLSCWVNFPNYANGNNNIISFNENYLRFRIIDVNKIGTIYTNNNSTSAIDKVTTLTKSLVNGAWNHLVITLDGDIFKFYINGEYAGTYTKNTGIIKVPSGFRIGTYNGTAENLTGKIDDVRIYNSILPEDYISQLYRTKTKVDKSGDIMSSRFMEHRENSFYFNLEDMGGTDNATLEVVDCTAKSIRLRFNKTPTTWQGKTFPLADFIEDGKTYRIYIKPNKNCNKNIADGTDNQYGRTYGMIGVHKYKISDNSVVKAEWGIREIKLYTGTFSVDLSTYKNYQLRFYPNCLDTTSWNNGDYIYDYIDIVPTEDNCNTNVSKQGIFMTGEFLEENSQTEVEKYNRTKINQIIEI